MLPCLNLALSDVMAHISQLERQTGIKEIAIVHMARPRPGVLLLGGDPLSPNSSETAGNFQVPF